MITNTPTCPRCGETNTRYLAGSLTTDEHVYKCESCGHLFSSDGTGTKPTAPDFTIVDPKDLKLKDSGEDLQKLAQEAVEGAVGLGNSLFKLGTVLVKKAKKAMENW